MERAFRAEGSFSPYNIFLAKPTKWVYDGKRVK